MRARASSCLLLRGILEISVREYILDKAFSNLLLTLDVSGEVSVVDEVSLDLIEQWETGRAIHHVRIDIEVLRDSTDWRCFLQNFDNLKET